MATSARARPGISQAFLPDLPLGAVAPFGSLAPGA